MWGVSLLDNVDEGCQHKKEMHDGSTKQLTCLRGQSNAEKHVTQGGGGVGSI
jgi:hypothetical protein